MKRANKLNKHNEQTKPTHKALSSDASPYIFVQFQFPNKYYPSKYWTSPHGRVYLITVRMALCQYNLLAVDEKYFHTGCARRKFILGFV